MTYNTYNSYETSYESYESYKSYKSYELATFQSNVLWCSNNNTNKQDKQNIYIYDTNTHIYIYRITEYLFR